MVTGSLAPIPRTALRPCLIIAAMRAFFRYWGNHFLWMDSISVLLLTSGLAIWLGVADDSHGYIKDLLAQNRSGLYRTVATISGTMTGFTIGVASVITTVTSSERFRLLRGSRYYGEIWKTFTQTAKLLGLLTVVALVGLLVDKETSPTTWMAVPLFLSGLLAVARLARAIWVLEMITKIVSSPPPNESL